MSAGQTLNIYIEMDYNRKDMAKDVSVVVWGDGGKVCLEHKGGIETDEFVTIWGADSNREALSDSRIMICIIMSNLASYTVRCIGQISIM